MAFSPLPLAECSQFCFFTTASGVPRLSIPLSLHASGLTTSRRPKPTLKKSWPPAPTAAPLTCAVEAGGYGVQEGVLWGQQPLHDRHGLPARVRGAALEVIQRGGAQGGALPAQPGRPMRQPAFSPPSRRRRVSAPNPEAFGLALQCLSGSLPHGPASFPRAWPAPATWPRTGRGSP